MLIFNFLLSLHLVPELLMQTDPTISLVELLNGKSSEGEGTVPFLHTHS